MRLLITVREDDAPIDHPKVGIEMILPEADLSLPWEQFAVRYLQPAIEQIKDSLEEKAQGQSLKCPLCVSFTYTDADGNTHIFFDPCDQHNPELNP